MMKGRPLFAIFIFLAGASSAIPMVTTSSSGRFQVLGPNSAENTEYTRLAEDMTTRLEKVLGAPALCPRGAPMEIVLDDSRSEASAVTVRIVSRDGAPALKRMLIIRRASPLDNGLFQEGLVRLMLAGMVERRRREAGLPPVIPEFPQWFTMGLAQNLDKEMLSWNRKISSAASGLGTETATAADVMSWDYLPAGWHGRRAECGLATAWILSYSNGLDAVMGRLVKQGRISPEWVADTVVHSGSVEKMNSKWREWRQRQGRLIQEFGGLSSDMIEQFRWGLPLEVRQGGKSPVTIRLRPDEVVAGRRKYPEVAMMAVGKIEQIGILTLGKALELVEVGEQYAWFYEGVARGSWAVTLKWRLARAEAALDRLDQLTRAREAYLDEVESEWEPQGLRLDGRSGTVTVLELEKSRVESYLDWAEERFHKP